jgi:hypothetical protein
MIDRRLIILLDAVNNKATDTAELWRGAAEVFRGIEREGGAMARPRMASLCTFVTAMWKVKRCGVAEAQPVLTTMEPYVNQPDVAFAALEARAATSSPPPGHPPAGSPPEAYYAAIEATTRPRKWSCGHKRESEGHCAVCAAFGRRTTT